MKNKNSKLNFALLIAILMFTFAGLLPAQAADYYVSPSGTSTNPGTIAQPWSLAKANTTLKAGDTAYLLAGTYSTSISPSNSGSAGYPITYRNNGTDVVTITGSYAISINGKSYITVTGINGGPCQHCLSIKNGSYNIVSYGKFGPYSTPGDGKWELNVIDTSSQYNWIHHNEFHDFGACVGTPPNGDDQASVLDIGNENLAGDATKYNLIEDNVFYHGGHHVVALETGYNTFRNNYVHNDAWTNGAGNRTLYVNNLVSTLQPDVGHNIIEGNRFGYAAKPCDAITVGNVAISTSYNIFRYNAVFYSNANGLGTSAYGTNSQGSYNHFFNNTIFDSGLANILNPSLSADTYTSEHTAISFFSSSNKGNVVRNNLFSSTKKAYGGSTSAQSIANDWDGNTLGNPLFVNASTTPANPSDGTVPNLNLQPTSPAIDKGGPLTTVAAGDAGSGTTLVVADAGFFQDGSYAPPGRVQPDWIAVGTATNAVQIVSINYSTNTITLANSISRTGNDPVWLYKKSDGVRVLFGSAPDAGAFEYSSVKRPSAPANLKVAP